MKELRKVIAKTLIAVWALAGGSLSVMQTGYVSDVPGAKYIFTVLQNLDGSGLEILFLLAAKTWSRGWLAIVRDFNLF